MDIYGGLFEVDNLNSHKITIHEPILTKLLPKKTPRPLQVHTKFQLDQQV